MSSSIRQRGKKKTWVYYGYYNGREIVKSLKTTDKKIAEREQRQWDAKFTDPNFIVKDKKNSEIDQFWKAYREDAQPPRLRPRTLEIQSLHWKQLLDFAKPLRLGDITTDTLKRFQRNQSKPKGNKKGKEPQSVNNCLKDIRTIFNWAIREGFFSGANPTNGVVPLDVPEKVVDFYSKEQLEKLLENLTGQARLIVLLCAWCGLRKQEACNLKWEQIDLESGFVQLSGEWTKTKKARSVPIPNRVREALPEKSEGYVFHSERISKGKSNYIYDPKKTLKKAMKASGLTDKTPYQKLRRSYSHLMKKAGVDARDSTVWAGHSLKVMMKHYDAVDAPPPEVKNL